MKTGSGVEERKWLRWLVSVSAGLYLVCCCVPVLFQPNHQPIRRQEITGIVVAFILPPIAAMILSACGVFSVTFVISLWILFWTLFSLEGDPVGPLRFALAVTICIVSAIQSVRGIIRTFREDSMNEQAETSPLYIALRNGEIKVVQELVEQGADVNEKSGSESLLEVAVESGDFEMVRFLVSHGARVGSNCLVSSLIRRARHLKHDDIANFLQEEWDKISGATSST